MNLIDRIARALDDESLHIDPTVFEQCALDLLQERLPVLIPISGGSDAGRDADQVGELGQPPTRLVVTSSRSFEHSVRNLRGSLTSIKKNGLAGRSVCVATLAEMNHSRRQRLGGLAASLDFDLEAVFDRSYFAQSLRMHGDWRVKLLNLPGGPFSLSRTSGYRQPTLVDLVGRDRLLTQLSALTNDAVIWGPPGVGKSALLERIEGLYFVDEVPTEERLLDDLISTGPSIVVVDDSISRPEVLDMLRKARKQETLDYAVIAVGWPHQVNALAARLDQPMKVEVDLLPRTQIAQIVRTYGIDSHRELRTILDQARGRPGWATRLADLLNEGRVQSVYTGEATRDEVRNYLLKSGLPLESTEVLGVVALIGGVVESEVGGLAASLGISRLKLTEMLNSSARAGLLDVRETRSLQGVEQQQFSVAPELVATSLASEVLFGEGMPPISAVELFDNWPAHQFAIAECAIRVALAGNQGVKIVAKALFARAMEYADVREQIELRHLYLHLGNEEARDVVESARAEWLSICKGSVGLSSGQYESARELASLAAEAYRRFEDVTFVEIVLATAEIIGARGLDPEAYLGEFIGRVRGFGPDGNPRSDLVVSVWGSLLERGTGPSARLLAECMRPVFEGSWHAAEGPGVIEIAAHLVSPEEMRLLESIWDSYEDLDLDLGRAGLEALVELIGKWASVALRRASGIELETSPQQVAFAVRLVRRMGEWVLGRSSPYPGIRALVRSHAEGSGVRFPVEADPLIRAFFDTREPQEPASDWGESRRKQIQELVTLRLDEPETLVGFLADVKPELDSIRHFGFVDPVRSTFAVIAAEGAGLRDWLQRAHQHDLAAEAYPLLTRYLAEDDIDPEVVALYMNHQGSRGYVIEAALSATTDAALFACVFDGLKPDDTEYIKVGLFRGDARDVEIALLKHPLNGVRAATAIAMVDAPDLVDFDPSRLDGLWRAALAGDDVLLRLPESGGREHSFYDRLAEHAPDVYEDLLARFIRTYAGRDWDWRALHESFEETATMLPGAARRRLWREVSHGPRKSDWFKVLAGDDAEWIGVLLEEGEVEAAFVLNTVTGLGTSPSIEDLARLLVPRGCDPGQVASRIQFGVAFGANHDRIAGYLIEMSRLTESTDPAVRAVGIAGRQYFEPMYAEAVSASKKSDIFGE